MAEMGTVQDLSQVGDEALAEQARNFALGFNARLGELVKRGLRVSYTTGVPTGRDGDLGYMAIDELTVIREVKL